MVPKTICKVCKGQGVLERGDVLVECDCEVIRRMALSMDPHIRKADVLPTHATHPLTDMANQSCFVVASWKDMRSLIKVTIIKNYPKLIRITSDAIIRNVFVGGASKAARQSDYEGEIFSNLQDYMDLPYLVIVRLNELAYKNKAASGALDEALTYRIDREKPTWVLSDVDKPFSLGSHAYSKEVAELIASSFKRVEVKRIFPKEVFTNDMFTFSQPDQMGTSSASPGFVDSLLSEPSKPRVSAPPIPTDVFPSLQPTGISQPVAKKTSPVLKKPVVQETETDIDIIPEKGLSKNKKPSGYTGPSRSIQSAPDDDNDLLGQKASVGLNKYRPRTLWNELSEAVSRLETFQRRTTRSATGIVCLSRTWSFRTSRTARFTRISQPFTRKWVHPLISLCSKSISRSGTRLKLFLAWKRSRKLLTTPTRTFSRSSGQRGSNSR